VRHIFDAIVEPGERIGIDRWHTPADRLATVADVHGNPILAMTLEHATNNGPFYPAEFVRAALQRGFGRLIAPQTFEEQRIQRTSVLA